ncbi:tetratricopeptide repeat protein [Roseivirga pacifica]|uniref:tetratricopeptide repeat protein n=1 Tax=Roseivirga pacifica TaxID=1267423 RepID=UPI00227CDFD2|nr:hypothetical protein [Roseivirga pacifica]
MLDQRITSVLQKLAIALFAFSAIFFIYAWVTGDSLILPWDTETDFQVRPLLLEYFQLNGKPSGVRIDQILSWQKFTIDELRYLEWPQYVLLGLFVMAMWLITATISLLDRFSFLLGSGIIILMISQLRLEELGFAQEYITYGLMGAYFALTYYFQAFKPHSSFALRLGMSALVYTTLIVLFALFARTENTAMVATAFSVMGPAILAALFILFIAGENIYIFFKVTTSSASNGKNGLIHFSIIGIIYLLICVALFMEKNGDIQFDIFLIEPRTLLLCSVVAAYFSFDNRHKSYEIEQQLGLLKQVLFPIAAALTLGLYAYCDITGTDALRSGLDWVIILAHFTMGVAYFVYTLINFLPEVLQKLPVWKIYYQGERTAILTLRLMGFILFLGGIFYTEYRPFYQVKAGQYAMLGALGEHVENDLIAKQYYDQSVYYEFYNFKANYGLSRLLRESGKPAESRNQLRSIFRGQEHAKARIKLANSYAESDDIYRELTTLQQTPEATYNAEVQNNLALAHYRFESYDSAYKYLSKSRAGASIVSEGNLAALNYDVASLINFDTTVNYSHTDNIHVKINRQALANEQKLDIPFSYSPAPDTLLVRSELFYLYNAAITQGDTQGEKVLEALNYYLENPKNEQYDSFLLLAKAVLLYDEGMVNEAFKTLNIVIARSPISSGFPLFVKAIWCFDQGLNEETVKYVNESKARAYQDEQLYEFIEAVKNMRQYTEGADISQALAEAKSLQNGDSTAYANALTKVASMNAFDAQSTLTAIELLEKHGASTDNVYKLLQEAVSINNKSPQLLEAYIYQCVENGLSSFGRTALDKYSTLVEYEQYFEVAKTFNQKLEARRNNNE